MPTGGGWCNLASTMLTPVSGRSPGSDCVTLYPAGLKAIAVQAGCFDIWWLGRTHAQGGAARQ
jgi:hypothetical protein